MTERLNIERDGVRLSCLDFGGKGINVVLLHGAAGYAGEWSETAVWMTEQAHVVAFDQRGHGRSERRPPDVSRGAFVADAAAIIDELGLAPVVIAGQSLGAHTAFLVAASHPELVSGLVVAEAGPGTACGPDDATDLKRLLAAWPVPFRSREAAIEYFGGPSHAAETWVDGFEQRADGLWPAFDASFVVEAVAETRVRPYWDEWRSITCPTLIVRAEHGIVPIDEANTMAASLPGAKLVTVAGAGHDLHLERPEQWRATVSRFLTDISAMPADDRRHAEVARVVDKIVAWADSRPDVTAVAVVGSWARGTARMNSDLDLVVLTDNRAAYLTDDGWAAEITGNTVLSTVQHGALTERRLITRSGLELEVGFATPRWASTPVDPGTACVVADGLRPIVDPDGLLDRLLDAAALGGPLGDQ